jgi:hypothetical protein
MGMEPKGLAPGVEDGRDAERPSQVLRIPSEGLERVARRADEQIVDDTGATEGQPAELVGQREDDMEVRDGEQVGAACAVSSSARCFGRTVRETTRVSSSRVRISGSLDGSRAAGITKPVLRRRIVTG